MNNILNYLFPVGGGISGSIIGFITWEQIIGVAMCAFIGAIIGYFTKYFLDKILKKKK